MKLFGLLTIALLFTSSLASLRGNNEEEEPDTRRRLANYIYEEFEGVCRKNSNGTGGGQDGVDYDKFMRKDDPSVSYTWCKNKCNNQSSCTGFEYSDLGADTQCEIWKKPIRGFVKKDKHNCMVKGERAHHYDYNWGGCRKFSDGTGKGNNKDEYDLYKGMNYRDCKEKCSKDSDCKGFEHSWTSENLQCEIWHHPIRSVEPKDYLECYIKVYD